MNNIQNKTYKFGNKEFAIYNLDHNLTDNDILLAIDHANKYHCSVKISWIGDSLTPSSFMNTLYIQFIEEGDTIDKFKNRMKDKGKYIEDIDNSSLYDRELLKFLYSTEEV